MTNRSAVALAAILFRPGGATYLSLAGKPLPAPPWAARTAVAALWDRPSSN